MRRGASFSDSDCIRAPVSYSALDVAAFPELARLNSPNEIRDFLVGRESQRYVLPKGQVFQYARVRPREKARESRSLFRADDAILSNERHMARQDHPDEQRNRDDRVPPRSERRRSQRALHRDDGVRGKNGHHEKMPRSKPSSVIPVALRSVGHSVFQFGMNGR